MNLTFFKSKKDRGGVVLVALLTLSFGAVGALVFVQLIATRALMVDSAKDALKRRVVLSNSKALAKHYLYDQVVPAPFGLNDTDVIFDLTDGSDSWAQFAMAGFSATQYAASETPLTRTRPLNSNGKENNNINEYQNRFTYGHNSRAYTVRPDIQIGDGVALMDARDDENVQFSAGTVPANAFRVFQHRMTFFIKARSPILGGDGIYTLGNDLGEDAGRIFGRPFPASANVSIEGRVFHTAGDSLTGSNYDGSGENTVGAGSIVASSGNGSGISNFPDIVHTWGRQNLTTQAADYEGRFPRPNQLEEFARLKAVYEVDSSTEYYRVSENPVGNYPGFNGEPLQVSVPILEYRLINFDGTLPATGTRIDDETYTDGATYSVDPNHGNSFNKIPAGARVSPSGRNMAQSNTNAPKQISQTLRRVGALTINTLRINLNTITRPVFVESGVEELELICDGMYDGQPLNTNRIRRPQIVFIAQPQALQRVRVYGSQNDRLFYLSVLDTSPVTDPPAPPTQLRWWWHDAANIVGGPPNPSFRLVAEVHGSIIDFEFPNATADVEIKGGFRHSNDILAGFHAGNRLIIKPEFINPTLSVNGTLGFLELAASRVGWIETYITAGAEGDRD